MLPGSRTTISSGEGHYTSDVDLASAWSSPEAGFDGARPYNNGPLYRPTVYVHADTNQPHSYCATCHQLAVDSSHLWDRNFVGYISEELGYLFPIII